MPVEQQQPSVSTTVTVQKSNSIADGVKFGLGCFIVTVLGIAVVIGVIILIIYLVITYG